MPRSTHPHRSRALTRSGRVFKSRIDHPLVFRATMFLKVPMLGITAAFLDEIDLTTSRLVLPFNWTARDLFGRVSIAAILASAEACSLSLLMLNVHNQGADITPTPRAIQIECLRECRAQMTFEVEEGEAYGEVVAEAIAHGDEVRRDLTVVGRDPGGRVTHRVHIDWSLSPSHS